MSELAAVPSAEIRETLGKLVAMLSSTHEGERANAVDMLGRKLANAGLSWAWLSDVVSFGELRGSDREGLLSRLVADRLADGLLYAWCMLPEEAWFVRSVVSHKDVTGRHDLSGVNSEALTRAIDICDSARKRADAKGPRSAPRPR